MGLPSVAGKRTKSGCVHTASTTPTAPAFQQGQPKRDLRHLILGFSAFATPCQELPKTAADLQRCLPPSCCVSRRFSLVCVLSASCAFGSCSQTILAAEAQALVGRTATGLSARH